MVVLALVKGFPFFYAARGRIINRRDAEPVPGVTALESVGFWFGNYLPEKVKVIKKDLFDCYEKELKKYDQVVFLAGLSNDPMAEFSPAKNFIDNG